MEEAEKQLRAQLKEELPSGWFDLFIEFIKTKIQSSPSGGDFIPLGGTEEDKPVTGDIQMDSGYGEINLFKENVDEDFKTRVSFSDTMLQITSSTLDNTVGTTLNIRKEVAEISSNYEDSVGLMASQDFSEIDPNNKLAYAQRQYIDNKNSYSVEEILTGGVWIDAKPIYRVVIPFTLLGSSQTIDISSLNREIFIKKVVNILSPDGKYVSEITTFNGSPGELLLVNCNEASDVDEVYINSYTLNLSTGTITPYTPNSTGFLILEYTKTTD